MPPSIYRCPTTTTTPNSNPITQADQERQYQEERARCEWDFRLATVITPSTAGGHSDILGAIEFDPSDYFLATGGISRKIRIYNVKSLLGSAVISGEAAARTEYRTHVEACSYYICTPAKLSSLRWKPGSGGGVIGAGDYDGVVTEYDLERHVPVFERDEHGGRRVWSVDYSRSCPHLGASASDDGTAHLWDSRCSSLAAAPAAKGCVLSPSGTGSPVCSAEFDPLGGSLIGLGCADTNGYVYDVRMAARPVSVLRGHRRTVTYVRFVGDGRRVVTASTDGSLKMWDSANSAELKTYAGHVNTRSFVGLSVWRTGGLVGCGSESSEVYIYDMRWSDPIWVNGFDGSGEGERGFVSSIAWRQAAEEDDQCMVVAGGSNGALHVLVGERRKAS